MPRKLALVGLKALVSIGLIALAMRNVDVAAVRAQLAAADPLIVSIAIALTIAMSPIQAERWRIVLDRLGCTLRFGSVWRLVLIGNFFNQTLPSTIGGDAFKGWGAYRLGVDARTAIASILIDRAAGLASLLLMIIVGLRWLFELIAAPSARLAVVIVIIGAVLGMVSLLFLGRFSPTLERWRVTRLLVSVIDGMRALLASARATAQVVLLTILVFVVMSYVVHLLARGLAIDLDFRDALLLIPLVALVTVLPISIAGWGLRESAMVVALGLVGTPAAAAFSLSVLYGLVVMASGLPGGVIWLVTRQVAPVPGDAPFPEK
jgi:glycosyltransferase 2 family protein